MADAQTIQIQNVGASALNFNNVNSTIILKSKTVSVGQTTDCYSPIDEVLRDVTLYNYINTNEAVLVLNGVAQAKIPTLRWFNTVGISPSMIGDVTGTSNLNVVAAIRGTNVAVTAPTLGQVLTYDGVNYTPSTPVVNRLWLTVTSTAFTFNAGTGRFELQWSNVLYNAFDLLVNLFIAPAGKYVVILPLASSLGVGTKSDRKVVLQGRDPNAFLQVRPNAAESAGVVLGAIGTTRQCVTLLERLDSCLIHMTNEVGRRIIFQQIPTNKVVATRAASISSAGFSGGGAAMVWDTALIIEDEDQFLTAIPIGYNGVSPVGLVKKVNVSFSLTFAATNATSYSVTAFLLNVLGEVPGSRIVSGGQGTGDIFSMSHSVNTFLEVSSLLQLRVIQTNLTGNFTRAIMTISTI